MRHMTTEYGDADAQSSPGVALPAMELLVDGCRRLGVDLTPAQVAQFVRYYLELVGWNDKFNLTAITAYEDVQVKHFLDSLAALPLLMEELGSTAQPLATSLHLVDVGAGAGLPGIPLKIVWPNLKLTLMDGTGKKVAFLNHVIQALDLRNAEAVQGRAEELALQPAFRGQYDLVTARAVAPLNTLVEYLLPLARRGGLTVAYKGAGAPAEFVQARNAIEVLGGETVRFAPVAVPFLEEQRYILLVKKVRRTPNLYPRGQGLARKQPL